jgi:branched-chain amino acid transport system substrate-binding protein
MWSRRAALGATAGLVAATATHGLPWSRPARAGSPVMIGIITQNIGNFAHRGQQERWGAVLAIEDANRAGGIFGCAVDYISIGADDFLQNAAAFVKSSRDRHDSLLLVGGSEAEVVRAISAVAGRHDLIYLATVPCRRLETRAGGGASFAWAGLADDLARAVVVHSLYERDVRCAIVSSATLAASRAATAARNALANLGGVILAETSVPTGTRDFRASLSSITRVGPNVNIVAVAGLDLMVMRQQVQDLKLDRTGTWLFLSQSGCDRGPHGADKPFGVYAAHWHPDLPLAGVAAFLDRFRGRWADCAGPDDTAYAAYTAVTDLLQTIARTGTTSNAALIPALEGRSIKGSVRMQHDDARTDRATRAMRQTTYIISGDGSSRETISPIAPNLSAQESTSR